MTEKSFVAGLSSTRTSTDSAQRKRRWLEINDRACPKAPCLSNMQSTTFKTTNMKVDRTWLPGPATHRQTLLTMVRRITLNIITAVLALQLNMYLTEIRISATPSALWPSLLSMRTPREFLSMRIRMLRLSKSSFTVTVKLWRAAWMPAVNLPKTHQPSKQTKAQANT